MAEIDRLRLIDYSPLVSKYSVHEEKKQAVRNDYLHWVRWNLHRENVHDQISNGIQ